MRKLRGGSHGPDRHPTGSSSHETSRRWRFEMFNDEFGEAFIEANRDRVYDRYSPEEINRRNRNALLKWAAIIAVVLFGLWNFVAEWNCC
jgi:hypothetical protein